MRRVRTRDITLYIQDCQKIRKNIRDSKIHIWWMAVCQKLNKIQICCRRIPKCVQN